MALVGLFDREGRSAVLLNARFRERFNIQAVDPHANDIQPIVQRIGEPAAFDTKKQGLRGRRENLCSSAGDVHPFEESHLILRRERVHFVQDECADLHGRE
jgi:hypothetical protein